MHLINGIKTKYELGFIIKICVGNLISAFSWLVNPFVSTYIFS
jgi:hypothetical protein